MPRPKKPAPSCPTANELEQLRSRLQTLVSTGEAQRVDGELEQLLRSLGLDSASPTAWRDGFLLLACLHYDVGKPRRTNNNAQKITSRDDMAMLKEVIQLTGQGLTQEQAINKLASDPSKAHLFKFKQSSSKSQRAEAFRKRLSKIMKRTSGFEAIVGKPPESTVEEVLIDLALAEVEKRNTNLPRS